MAKDAHPARRTCAVSGRMLPDRELVPAALVRPILLDRIRADHPEIGPGSVISHAASARGGQR
jgi:hypothetical protein